MINFLDYTPNQPSKFRMKAWVKINNESRGTYNKKQIRIKTSVLRSSLYNCSDAYILEIGTIAIDGAGTDDAAKRLNVIFKNCASFTDCISEINDTQIDYAKDPDVATPMYNLIEYRDNYSKTTGSLWQYFRDEPVAAIANCQSFKSKIRITEKTSADGNSNMKIMLE